MGWNVNIEVKRSAIHGSGVFAAERIKAGTKVWQFDRSMHICTPTALAQLEAATLTQALFAGYVHEPSGLFLWYTDGMQFMNHADERNANVGLTWWPALTDDHIVALRDIEPGEELREDYRNCLQAGMGRDHWLAPLYRAFCPMHYRFLLSLFGLEEPAYPAAAVPGDGGAKLRRIPTSASRKIGFERTAEKPQARQAA